MMSLLGAGDSGKVDAAPLDVDDDFFDVLKDVLPVAAKWKAVGQALRLKLGELDSIAASHPHSTEDCLSEMLTQWLRRNYNVKRFGEPSWKRLVEVVGDPAGGANPALANQIAEKHRAKQANLKKSNTVRRHSFSMGLAEDRYTRLCEPDDLVQDIMQQPVSLMRKYLWYHGKTSRQDSEELLKDAPDGYFLVRESTTQPNSHVLSTKHQGEILHRIIRFREARYTYELEGTRKCFQRITELVQYYQEHYISTAGEILRVSCPQNLESQSQTSGGTAESSDKSTCSISEDTKGAEVTVNSTTPSKSLPLEEHHDYEAEPPIAITSIYSMPVVSPAIPPPLPPRLPTVLHRKRAESNDLLDKTQTSIITGTAESSEKFTCSISEDTKGAEVSANSTTPLKSPLLEEVVPDHDYEAEPIYSMPVVSPAIPPPLPPRPPTVLHRKRAEPNDLLDKIQTSIITGTADSSEKFTCSISEDTKGAEVTANSTTPLKSPLLEEVVPDHDYEAEPIYSMPVVSPAIPPPLPPWPPTLLHRKRAELNDLLDKTQTSIITGTAESSEKFTCSISEDTKGAEVTANSTTPLKSPLLEEVVPDHDYEAEPIYSMPVVSPAIPPPLPPRPPTVLHRKRAELNDLLDKTQTSIITGTAESSEKFTCSISEDTKGAEVTANSTTPLKSPPLEEVVPDHDYEAEPIYSMPVVSPAIPPPLPPRPPTVLHRKRAEPNDLLDKTQTSIITGVAESSEKFTCSTSGEGIKRAEVKSTASFKLCIIPSTQKSMAIEAELKHVIHHSVIKCTITHGGEREYEVAYKPEIRGRHTLSLKIDSHEIQSSPFAVFVHCPAYKLGQSLRTIPDTSSPQLSRPLGIALGICGSESLIVVCDSGKGSVSVLNREGNQIQEILPGGTPHGIAGGKDGSWYITLTDLHKIQKFTHEGVFIKGVGGKGSKPAQFKKPKGVAVNRGLVHVCDSGNSRVQIFDSDLNFVSSFGQKGSGPMSLMSPVDAAFDGSGHIYVADSLRNRVIQFSPKYLYIKTFGDERSASCKLNCPQGVCVGPNDVVYVTDCDHCVSVYQASGKLLANFGGRGGEVGRFSHPCGIAVDDDGFVYVSDRDNGRIQVF